MKRSIDYDDGNVEFCMKLIEQCMKNCAQTHSLGGCYECHKECRLADKVFSGDFRRQHEMDFSEFKLLFGMYPNVSLDIR